MYLIQFYNTVNYILRPTKLRGAGENDQQEGKTDEDGQNRGGWGSRKCPLCCKRFCMPPMLYVTIADLWNEDQAKKDLGNTQPQQVVAYLSTHGMKLG